ncbi:MAG: tryptophan--tRNA ligase [Rickettsiaceae bacterium]|nr:tryptophan--tRNA ligase [Rickettsiaceae bacterium]
MKKTVVSGIQTSGNLHIGNYLGAVSNWLNMQDEYDCYFFLADLHSLTVPMSADDLKKSTFEATATYLASGLDPDKSTIFLQSDVKEHSELAWMLNCITPIGWLKRMTQFKDKAGKEQDHANAGLFTYPVFMAADILLYSADIVPVGDDQKQHLELTRDIAGAVNRRFNKDVLRVPEPLIQGPATRVMSLRDGKKKMSKSDASDASRINLTDTPDVIIKKLKKSKTDTIAEISYDPVNRPEVSNLIKIFSALSAQKEDSIVDQYEGKGFSIFKKDLSDLVISKINPMNIEYQKIIKDEDYLRNTLKKGADKARVTARKTCDLVANEFGIV